MDIDANLVIEKLVKEIANLKLENAVLQVTVEELQKLEKEGDI